jgi:hypothetical protein
MVTDSLTLSRNMLSSYTKFDKLPPRWTGYSVGVRYIFARKEEIDVFWSMVDKNRNAMIPSTWNCPFLAATKQYVAGIVIVR